RWRGDGAVYSRHPDGSLSLRERSDLADRTGTHGSTSRSRRHPRSVARYGAWIGESIAGASPGAMDQGVAAEPGADLDVSRRPVGWHRSAVGGQAGRMGHPSFEPGARTEQAPHDLDRKSLRSAVA